MSNRYPNSNNNRSARSSSSNPNRGSRTSSNGAQRSGARSQASADGRRPMSNRPSNARTGRANVPTERGTQSPSARNRRPTTASRERQTNNLPSRQGSSASNRRTTSRATAGNSEQTSRNIQRRRSSQRRRGSKLNGWVKVLLVLLLVLLVVRFSPIGRSSSASAPPVTDALQQAATGLVSDEDKSGFDETIGSDSAILINADNGDVLYTKDADTQRAPASLTKMMTVYVAIKNNKNIDKEVKMPAQAIEAIEDTGAASSGLTANETVTIRDLLYAAILPSGADAANALALITSGNEKSFVELMNQEAEEMGLDSTHFANVTGLDDENQYSTCRDMARLLKIAMGNNTFEEVLTTRSYTTSENDTHPDGVKLTHTMDEYLSSFQRYFDTSGYEIVGGKTGYTVEAGNCLASVAQKKDSPTYIAVTMHAVGNSDQYRQSVKDAVNLYGKAYEE